MRRPSGCRKSGLRHFFEVFIAPLRLRRGQGAMQGNPCYARLFADLTRMSPNPIIASGGCGPRAPRGFSTSWGAAHFHAPPLFPCSSRGPDPLAPWMAAGGRGAAAFGGRGAYGPPASQTNGPGACGPRTVVRAARARRPPRPPAFANRPKGQQRPKWGRSGCAPIENSHRQTIYYRNNSVSTLVWATTLPLRIT